MDLDLEHKAALRRGCEFSLVESTRRLENSLRDGRAEEALLYAKIISELSKVIFTQE